MKTSGTILIVCAHGLEAKAVKSHLPETKKCEPPILSVSGNICLAVVGMGGRDLAKSFMKLKPEKFSEVWFFGLAGGLAPDAILGECYFCDPIVSEDGESLRSPLTSELRALPLVTSDRPVMSPVDRERLRKASMASLVDMEGRYFAEVCQEKRLPWGVVRVVSDTPAQPEFLPRDPKLARGLLEGARKLLRLMYRKNA